MKTQNLSHREKLMLPLALAIIVLVLYGAFRVRPALHQITSLRNELGKAVKGRETLAWPTKSPPNTQAIKTEISQLQDQKQSLIEERKSREGTLANLGESTQLQSLRIQISALAREHSITVLKNVPADSIAESSEKRALRLKLSDAPQTPTKLDAPVVHEYFQLMYARPLQFLQLSATFPALQGFIADLSGLNHQVHVASFKIKINDNPDEVSQPRLDTELILAL